MARRLFDEEGRVIPRAAAGLPDAARFVREGDPKRRAELDRARRVAFYVPEWIRKNGAMLIFLRLLEQRERARRPRKVAADEARLERYRAAQADPTVTSRKELARRTEPGDKDAGIPPWSTQALLDFERRCGLTPKK